MIGYYVHHHGSGHLHRAQAVAAEWGPQITGLSTLPRPDGWPGDWVRLEDDSPDGPAGGAMDGADVTARGHLHWVPVGHRGLSSRAAQIASWLDAARPTLLVSDHSVEVTLLARLHGVRVVAVVLPGERSDPAHLLGYGVSERLVAVWPPDAHVGTGLPPEVTDRLTCVGGLSRFEPVASDATSDSTARVVVLWGAGGHGPPLQEIAAARAQTPGWAWTVLGGDEWVEDPFDALRSADVVLTHAGQNAVAETAAARTPAIIVPQDRPFDEQRRMGDALEDPRWPALVLDSLPTDGWSHLLQRARDLDGRRWQGWCDGHAATRFADVLREVEAS